jgi:phage replication O-like protein O
MTTSEQATYLGFPFPNTTQIPNDVFDSLMPSLTGGELKVLLYICRRTYGFQKDSDRISLSQISKGIITKTGRVLDHGTGLCKRHVITALKTLEKKNIITVTRIVDETGLYEVNTYRLNSSAPHREEEPPEQVVTPSAPGVVNSGSPQVVNSSAPTKQSKQNKEEQNKDTDDNVAQALEQFGMTKSAVTSLIERYPAAYITEKLAMTRGLLAADSGLVAKNPVGWLRRAIEEDYKPPRNKERPTAISGRNSRQHKQTPKEQPREQNIIITPPQVLPVPDRQTELIWEQIVEQLTHDLPIGETKNRLTGTMLIEVTESKAVIFVPNRTDGAWVERRLYGQIQHAMKRALGRDVDLQFVTRPY